MAFLQRPSIPNMSIQDPQQPSSEPTPEPQPSRSLTSPRSRKQLTLFLAGASFLTLSGLITRRQVARRHLSTIPRFYQPSNRPPPVPVSGAFEAFEALNLATINVVSFMMMLTGGVLWAFDISSMDDLRREVRGGLGVDGSGRFGADVEEEFEEWVASVLQRKEDKERSRTTTTTTTKGGEGKVQRAVRQAREDGEEGEHIEERLPAVEDRITNGRGKPR
ncbi:hypothetical protein N7G274_004092 [Stereocaulon virgatum]|uniref:Altered inheritance of mitochondria protein 11 n=1 Tax=Stereocaulon virgatum TaxID=373712 RepID=A0ABR4AB96_9LECA